MIDAEAKLLDDLAALEAAATPGPWDVRDNFYIGRPERMSLAEVKAGDVPAEDAETHKVNARFIAACRAAVPVLLRVLREQQQKIVELLQWKQGKLTHLLDQQQARVADLREAALEVKRLLRIETAAKQCLALIKERTLPVLAAEIREILTEALKGN